MNPTPPLRGCILQLNHIGKECFDRTCTHPDREPPRLCDCDELIRSGNQIDFPDLADRAGFLGRADRASQLDVFLFFGSLVWDCRPRRH